jgi:hypothetical protein
MGRWLDDRKLAETARRLNKRAATPAQYQSAKIIVLFEV